MSVRIFVMGKRATKVDKQVRINELVKLISNGAVTSDLIRFASDHWGVTDRQAENYIREAREVIIADINQDRSMVVAEMLHISRTVIKKALEKGEYNNALGAMKLITRLGGLESK